MSTLEQRVTRIVAQQLGVPEERVVPEASFRDTLGADSLDTLEVVMALEEEFQVDLGTDASDRFETVQDAMSLIAARVPRAA